MKKWVILWKIATISLIGLDGRAGEEIASYTAKNTATGVACTYLSEILTKIPEEKTGVIKVVAKLENGNESTYDEVEYPVKGKVKKAQKMPTSLGEW